MILEQELRTFEEALPRLLVTNPGDFVIIRGETIGGIFPNLEEALDAGYLQFGLDTFLAKQIIEHEVPRYCSRNVTPWR